MFGGVRFGGTLTIDSAFELGFDHIALCAGAGRPTVIPMKNGLARGVRQASDFLMALQLTGAAKTDSVANLQVRMPIVVIGGGLTAIDTATESLAYYVVQVEKFLRATRRSWPSAAKQAVRASWTPEETRDGDGVHCAWPRDSRRARSRPLAKAAPESDSAAELVGRLDDRLPAAADRFAQLHAESRRSRARRSRKASGSPSACRRKRWKSTSTGMLQSITFSQYAFRCRDAGRLAATGQTVTLPARTILVAAGTQPNTVLAREDAHNVVLDGRTSRPSTKRAIR